MNPMTPMIKQWYEPPPVNSFQEFLIAAAWLILPWILMLWILAVVMHIMFPNNRAHYGAQAAVRLAYAWAGFWIGAVLLADVIVLLVINQVHGWTAVVPHAALIFVAIIMSFIFWYNLREELRASQGPLRKAQGGRQ
jgi:L-asparagine transporter-like permease